MRAAVHRVTTQQFCKAIVRHVKHLRMMALPCNATRVTQVALGARAGYAPHQINRWERGHSVPRLRQALNCLEAVRLLE